MLLGIYTTVFYQPLYNTLVFLTSIIPGGNVGVSIILLTLLVRFILLPFSHKSVVSQSKMRAIAPDIEKLKEIHKEDKQEQARKIMELYRSHGINPLSGILLVVIQLPIIFALYRVLLKGLPHLDVTLLYSFVHLPTAVPSMTFLWIVLSEKSIILAALAAVSQYFQVKLSIPPVIITQKKDAKPTFKDEFSKSFNMQMRYILPVVIFFVSYSISAAVALYWATNNFFSIAHELYVKKKAKEAVGK